MPAVLLFLTILCGIVFFILFSLRRKKGARLIQQGEHYLSPINLSPQGIIWRLDGVETKNRKIISSRTSYAAYDGAIALPLKRWNGTPTTLARLGHIAHVWALARMAENDPKGHQQREKAITHGRVIPLLSAFALIILMVDHKLIFAQSFPIFCFIWALCALTAIPTQFREHRATGLAKQELKRAGLYPEDGHLATILDQCIKGSAWCRVAGFPHILPK